MHEVIARKENIRTEQQDFDGIFFKRKEQKENKLMPRPENEGFQNTEEMNLLQER